MYLLAKIGADTAENERNFAESLPKIVAHPPLGAERAGRAHAGAGLLLHDPAAARGVLHDPVRAVHAGVHLAHEIDKFCNSL